MAAPVLQAMLLADQVYQDRATGKYVICGIFSAIHFVPKEPPHGRDHSAGAGTPGEGADEGDTDETSESSAPAQTPVPIARLVRAGSPFAYVSLTELQGSRKFELRYVDLEENNVLFGTTFEVSCRDPLETIQITVPLPPLPIPHEGVFVLELLCDGEMLGSHRVLAKSQHKG
ncbi:MAG: hypothetical protein AABP62_10960 [Planctomycetota bacterium]